MASQRFRNLELEGPPPPAGEADAGAAPAAPRRALEVGRGLELDTSGVVRTDFCRRCHAENPEGAGECQSCGAKLGGPDQESFDAAMRAEREARRREHEAEQAETRLPAALRAPREATIDARPGAALEPPAGLPDVQAPEARPDEPGFGAVIATGALLAAIFALVSMPVRLVFAAYAGQRVPSGALGEIALCAVVTLGLWWRFGAAVRRL
ncbi:MAG TPA: zinc-ribbon domain-containing protein [Myxococcota bacterium]|nr:zinc-ribbon domain-containing protein [Myxococcota bacterium]